MINVTCTLYTVYLFNFNPLTICGHRPADSVCYPTLAVSPEKLKWVTLRLNSNDNVRLPSVRDNVTSIKTRKALNWLKDVGTATRTRQKMKFTRASGVVKHKFVGQIETYDALEGRFWTVNTFGDEIGPWWILQRKVNKDGEVRVTEPLKEGAKKVGEKCSGIYGVMRKSWWKVPRMSNRKLWKWQRVSSR